MSHKHALVLFAVGITAGIVIMSAITWGVIEEARGDRNLSCRVLLDVGATAADVMVDNGLSPKDSQWGKFLDELAPKWSAKNMDAREVGRWTVSRIRELVEEKVKAQNAQNAPAVASGSGTVMITPSIGSITSGNLTIQGYNSYTSPSITMQNVPGIVITPGGVIVNERHEDMDEIRLRPYTKEEQALRNARADGYDAGWERGLLTIRLIKRNELKLGRPLTDEEIEAITRTSREDADEASSTKRFY